MKLNAQTHAILHSQTSYVYLSGVERQRESRNNTVTVVKSQQQCAQLWSRMEQDSVLKE